VAGQSDADLTRANAARVYDWLLGGTFNTPIDRVVGGQIESVWPSIRHIIRASRAFLRLAVNHMLDSGIRQFIELGAGLPVGGHVHHMVCDKQADAAVVYVDKDPAIAALGEAALHGMPRTAYVRGDVREPQEIFDAEATRRVIDLDEPVGLLMVEILHLVPDQARPEQLIDSYRTRLGTGSGVAFSHVTTGLATELEALNAAQGETLGQSTPRDHATLSPWLAGLSLIEPGLAPLPDWLLPNSETDDRDGPLRHTLAAIGYVQ
jgi:hypothetical protein